MQRPHRITKLAAILAAALLFASCRLDNANDQPVHLTGVQTSCVGAQSSSVGKVNGFLDIAGGTAYPAIFNWYSSLQADSIVVGSDTVADNSTSTFFAQQAALSYKTSQPGVTLPDATFDLLGSIAPGQNVSGNSTFVGVELFPSAAGSFLRSAVPAGPSSVANPLEVSVSVKINGEVAGSPASSNMVTFPITVVNSGTVCAQYAEDSDNCGPGYDRLVTCADAGS